jgi:hypothetical protein
MRILVLFACVLLSSSAFAECTTNARGVTACGNGQTVIVQNPPVLLGDFACKHWGLP